MSRFSVEAVFKGIDRISKPVRRMQNSVSRFTRKAERGLRRVDRAVTNVAKKFGRGLKIGLSVGIAGITSLAGATTLFIREFSKIEDAQAAFTPLLGGAKRAEELVAKLNETSATTPFQFQNLAETAKQLLPVMDGDIQNTIATIRMLGDTAGGNAQKLDSITRGFTKAMLKGRVDMEALNMIAEAGVPIFTELADSMGVSKAQLFEMSKAGQISTDDLTGAFRKMTTEGGIFFKGMEIASKTTSGRLSTLRDNVSLAAAEIGAALAPTIKELIGELTDVAQKVRAWAEANKGLIGAKFKEFVKLVKDNAADIFKWGKRILVAITVVGSLIIALKSFIAVMTAVNIVMALNPIGLIVLAIGLLIAAVAAVIIWWEDLVALWQSAPTWLKILASVIFGPVISAITAIVAIVKVVKAIWGPLKVFFIALWIGIEQQFNKTASNLKFVWGGIKSFFVGLWDGITSIFTTSIDFITDKLGFLSDMLSGIIDGITTAVSAAADLVGLGDDSGAVAAASAGVGVSGFRSLDAGQSPQASPQVVSSRSESTSRSEVTIRDETGRAEVTKKPTGGLNGVRLVQTGGL